MNIVFFLVFVALSSLPLLHSATDRNSFLPICPKRFSCPTFSPFMYPFYNATENRCGLIKVNCTLKGGNIQVGGMSYTIVGKNEVGSSISIYNRTFRELVESESCEALMNNFTSPSPLLYSISIAPFITLFKCSKNLTYDHQMDAYFHQLSYTRHNTCKHHNFYYQYSFNNATAPSDLPHTCQVIQLPVKEPWQFEYKRRNVTGIYSLLSSEFSVSFQLSPSCNGCNKKGRQCDTYNGHFQCLHANNEGRRNSAWVLLLSALSVGAVTALIVIIVNLKCKTGWRKSHAKGASPKSYCSSKFNVNLETFLKDHEFLAPKRYSYSQVQKMTNSFEVKLGQGGFGSVYKGSLCNGNLVAVKVLSELKGNGQDFINEVASVGRTSHVNIVNLVGFCLEGHQRALIYEFMPNGSLEKFIYERNSLSSFQLGWKKLYEIAIGIAQGLEYLHRGCNTRILHFDIKPHNILLDKDFCPKISDFGLAKLFPENRSMISMSNMRGTPGYIAPELFSRSFGEVSHKSDVYSYGMMILEMVGGRRNIEVEVDHTSEIYYPHWIYKKVELDEEQLGLHGIVNDEENKMARKMIIVGLWCIQTNPLNRPTITKVLEMLEGELGLLDIPPKPYLSSPSRWVHESSEDHLQSFSSSVDNL